MTKLATVEQHISDVTSEQIGRCHKVIHASGNFYQVESEKDNLKEYKVSYSQKRGFQCSCKSGQTGFSNVTHASGVCKHVRWAMACRAEEKAAMAELERLSTAQAVVERARNLREMNRIEGIRDRGRVAILESVAMAREVFGQ